MIGLAFFGSASFTLFSTIFLENSASVARSARWLTMTGSRASGAMVATYWSVFVTVRMAHADMTEIGISKDASTMRIHEMTPRVRRALGFFAEDEGAAGGVGGAGTAGDAGAAGIRPLPAAGVSSAPGPPVPPGALPADSAALGDDSAAPADGVGPSSEDPAALSDPPVGSVSLIRGPPFQRRATLTHGGP